MDGIEGRRVVRIAHISDLHCGSPYFVPDLMERAIMEINDLEPAIVVCSGDLTSYGFKQEYAEAKGYLERLKCEALVVVPGTGSRWWWRTKIRKSASCENCSLIQE